MRLLKARWGRYAVIGAVIRAERGVRLNAPLAGRVSAAISAEPALGAHAVPSRAQQARLRWWQPLAGRRRGRGRCRAVDPVAARPGAAHRDTARRATPAAPPRAPPPGAVALTAPSTPAPASYVTPPAPLGAPDAGAEHAAGQLRRRPQRVFLAGDAAQSALRRSSRASRPPAPQAESPPRTMSDEQCARSERVAGAGARLVVAAGSVLARGAGTLARAHEPGAHHAQLRRHVLALARRPGGDAAHHPPRAGRRRVRAAGVARWLGARVHPHRRRAWPAICRTSARCWSSSGPQQESCSVGFPAVNDADRELLRHPGSGAHAPEPPRHARDHGHAQGRVPLRLSAVDR